MPIFGPTDAECRAARREFRQLSEQAAQTLEEMRSLANQLPQGEQRNRLLDRIGDGLDKLRTAVCAEDPNASICGQAPNQAAVNVVQVGLQLLPVVLANLDTIVDTIAPILGLPSVGGIEEQLRQKKQQLEQIRGRMQTQAATIKACERARLIQTVGGIGLIGGLAWFGIQSFGSE